MFNNIMQFFRICNASRDNNDIINSIKPEKRVIATPPPTPPKMNRRISTVSNDDIEKTLEVVIDNVFIDKSNRDAYFAEEQRVLLDALSVDENPDTKTDPDYFFMIIGDGFYLNLDKLPKDRQISLDFVDCNITAKHRLTKRKIKFPNGHAIFYKGVLQGYFDCDGILIDEDIYTITEEQIKKVSTYTYSIN